LLGFAGCSGSVLCLVLFSFVKSGSSASEFVPVASVGSTQLDISMHPVQLAGKLAEAPTAKDSSTNMPLKNGSSTSKPPNAKRGIVLAIFCGCVQGVQFVPASIFSQVHPQTQVARLVTLRLVFAQYTGSFVGAFLIYAIYGAVQRARKLGAAPVPLQAMLPSICSGIIWGSAGIFAMVAIDGLGYGIGYALVTNGAFLVSVLWSTVYFREISGRRNLILFAAAVGVNLCSSLAIATQRSLSESTEIDSLARNRSVT